MFGGMDYGKRQSGVEEKLVRICAGLHDGVEARMILDGAHSRWFTVETGLQASDRVVHCHQLYCSTATLWEW